MVRMSVPHWSKCKPVFVSLAGTDGKLLHLKIDVLAPEPDRFHNAERIKGNKGDVGSKTT